MSLQTRMNCNVRHSHEKKVRKRREWGGRKGKEERDGTETVGEGKAGDRNRHEGSRFENSQMQIVISHD